VLENGDETSSESPCLAISSPPKSYHAESIAASKYASFSAVWAAELFASGVTLLTVPGFPRRDAVQ
jgi:hypothetical protein